MALFRKETFGDRSLPKDDRGSGSFDNYGFNLVPKNRRVTMRLEGSGPHQDEIADAAAGGEVEITTATPSRSTEDDRTDAPIPVRLFLGRRVTGVVGSVPRGLESVYDETIRRLDGSGSAPRIPVAVVRTKQGWRVDLLMGETR